MPDNRTYTAAHTITVAAPARAVYDLLADVSVWPRNFAPTEGQQLAARWHAATA